MLFCQACGQSLNLTAKAGFREECPRCGAQLHCCLNCRFYAPGMHNDCRETQSDRVVDKDRGNFCEYFQFVQRDQPSQKQSPKESQAAKDRFQALFATKRERK